MFEFEDLIGSIDAVDVIAPLELTAPEEADTACDPYAYADDALEPAVYIL
jgi:hypothetical protein